jgi:hypothetical protein
MALDRANSREGCDSGGDIDLDRHVFSMRNPALLDDDTAIG